MKSTLQRPPEYGKAPITQKDSLQDIIIKMAENDPRAETLIRVITEKAEKDGKEELLALADMNIRGTDIVVASIAYVHACREACGIGFTGAAAYHALCAAPAKREVLGLDGGLTNDAKNALFLFVRSFNKHKEEMLFELVNDRKFLNALYEAVPGLPPRSAANITLRPSYAKLTKDDFVPPCTGYRRPYGSGPRGESINPR